MLNDPKDRKIFPKLPEADIEALKGYGRLVDYEDGETVEDENTGNRAISVVLAGALRVIRRVANAEELIGFHTAGEFSGDLCVLTKEISLYGILACGHTKLLRLEGQSVRKLLAENSPLGDMIVTTLARRARQADHFLVQEEKLAALGKMAAGLAHELNNPATAARRAAQLMIESVRDTPMRFLKVDVSYTPEARETLLGLAKTILGWPIHPPTDPLELSDREQALLDWLEERCIPRADEIAPIFAEASVDPKHLTEWISKLGPNVVKSMFWLESVLRLTFLARDIESSTDRIVELVTALKEYSYMDQARFQEVDIHQGIENTLKILTHKLKKGVTVKREYGQNLPKICAYAGELNQVWTNLIDNAVDAMDGHGVLTIRTEAVEDKVVVAVSDTGAGVPKDIQNRIFEPFFTTKAQGKGTGLGLDITYRVVVFRHGGTIRVRSKPGDTVFEVVLPVQPPKEEQILASLEAEVKESVPTR